jgi:glucodextranase-like protein
MHRVRAHRGLEPRRRRLPLPARLLLTVSVVALGGAVFLTATGGIGPLVGSLGSTLDAAFGKLLATPMPSASEVIATDSPIIAAPDHPYTNVEDATLRITVPGAVIGTTATVRIYLALAGLELAPITEVPVGSTTQLQVSVHLTKGRNDFSATVVRDGAESPQAPVVSIVLDQDPPKVTISSPKQNAAINDVKVTIKGTTQANSDLIARNGANGASVTGKAAADGTFSLVLPIDQGANVIDIRATDPAGNQKSVTLTVKQGSGDMAVRLSASLYTIHVSNPPNALQLRVLVMDPSGAPLEGATAYFTLQVPGIGPLSNTATTDSGGRASFTTSLVGPMTKGNGLATVLVSYPGFGDTTDRITLLFVK